MQRALCHSPVTEALLDHLLSQVSEGCTLLLLLLLLLCLLLLLLLLLLMSLLLLLNGACLMGGLLGRPSTPLGVSQVLTQGETWGCAPATGEGESECHMHRRGKAGGGQYAAAGQRLGTLWRTCPQHVSKRDREGLPCGEVGQWSPWQGRESSESKDLPSQAVERGERS